MRNGGLRIGSQQAPLPAGTASVSYNNYSLFADDNIEIGRLTLRPVSVLTG